MDNLIMSEEFTDWLNALDTDSYKTVMKILVFFSNRNFNLDSDYVKKIKASKINSLKELKIQCKGIPIRVFYVVENGRAILLTAGSKKGWKESSFYKKLISKAERIYENL